MQLAQLNIATAKHPLDSPELKDFVDNIEPINALAESSDGFVWRLKDESGNATDVQAFHDPNIIVNMSVWQSVDALKTFMFRTHHIDFMKRKSEWFQQASTNTYALWWVPEGQQPSLKEAIVWLEYLREHGDSPFAFSFKSNFTEQEAAHYVCL